MIKNTANIIELTRLSLVRTSAAAAAVLVSGSSQTLFAAIVLYRHSGNMQPGLSSGGLSPLC